MRVEMDLTKDKMIAMFFVSLLLTGFTLMFLGSYYSDYAFKKIVRIPITKFNVYKFDNMLIFEYHQHAFMFVGYKKDEILQNIDSIKFVKATCYYTIDKKMGNVIMKPILENKVV